MSDSYSTRTWTAGFPSANTRSNDVLGALFGSRQRTPSCFDDDEWLGGLSERKPKMETKQQHKPPPQVSPMKTGFKSPPSSPQTMSVAHSTGINPFARPRRSQTAYNFPVHGGNNSYAHHSYANKSGVANSSSGNFAAASSNPFEKSNAPLPIRPHGTRRVLSN